MENSREFCRFVNEREDYDTYNKDCDVVFSVKGLPNMYQMGDYGSFRITLDDDDVAYLYNKYSQGLDSEMDDKINAIKKEYGLLKDERDSKKQED